ncbi:MAG: hypothetical protein EPN82_02550 [Bacteroidetes bacterium]|nr:MAG: hypothetical protein EPN82_02550 [Bacteroidota bacterium]
MEKVSTEIKDIREQHYFFAQGFLYDFIQRHPDASLDMFSIEFWRDSIPEHLKELWDVTFSEIQELDTNAEKIEVDRLPYIVKVIDEFLTIVVITLPVPQEMTESYYVGIIYRKTDKNSEPNFRYFTLEYHNKRKSAICELSECKHTLWGFTKNLSVDEFIEEIKSIVIE